MHKQALTEHTLREKDKNCILYLHANLGRKGLMQFMEQKKAALVSEAEMEKQRGLMDEVAGFGGGKYEIVTYGCQMNARDSQTLAGLLENMGYAPAQSREEADLILFNTCCVRDNAERRVFGNVGHLQALKRAKPRLVVGVCGCMMQQDGAAQKLLKSSPFVDLIFGTGNLHRLPEMLLRVLRAGERVVQIDADPYAPIAEDLPASRGGSAQAFVNIMFGCNNFCTYCIVPYVRGRERSRAMDSIVREVDELAAQGVKEITLLGQNVNSYRAEDGSGLADLLRRLDGHVPRIRFMTSHPKDLSDDLIEAMASSRSVCHQLHLPVQSGSDTILQAMNRCYTAAHYLGLVQKLRAAMPDIGLSTDIIVGFPGETEADFLATMELDKAVRFDSAYTFIYSKRQGTRAAQMENQVEEEIKKERIYRLIAQQEQITSELLQKRIGSRERILIEGISARDENACMGRTDAGITVNVEDKRLETGRFADVLILSAGANTLRGRVLD